MIDIHQHRQQFLGLKNKYYFNYGGQGILPQSALQKIIDSYQYIDQVGPFGLKINGWIYENIAATKKAIAQEIGVTSNTITLTENVTASCNIPLWGIDWQEGEEILLTDAEHPGIIAIVKEISRRFGVKIITCPIIETLNDGNPLEVIKNHLTSNTRLVIISHILWNTGQILPLKEIVSVCHSYSDSKKQIQVLVDGAQSAGSLPLNLVESRVDFYGCTGHKWLCGASGVGFLYTRQDLITSLSPTFIGWRGLNYSKTDLPFTDDGSRFEVATSAYPLFTALQEAIAIHQQWGTIEQRYHRISELSSYLWEELTKIETIECLKNTPPKSGLISFYLRNGKDANNMVKTLEEKGFYLRTLVNPYCIRACVHYLTLETEIEALIQIIRNEN
ncbi:MAG: aminotransferase class V-fold PLP-dependent enzyme [Cyanobacteria bacterium]|nr:aminotransferase class V-fold PLP-dependent enzyme [Cyanobacteria bacterium CG_2015-16_32_12]NCO79430.1 aminotransferase class V-fold PLP-dependent enzyme [Cyanobacteria bacterium CG_2015-22_32_23]NCQ05596.1 aminotransferase class V-fold PLP-dependent enzyme [Cyanobacteria bacterium CG_2015-09_32_10]NCQ42324.1 aminotransferase class V-fold PLP-dependent enzyme [Cyanobacteria bacterium CG_2015-04_32_10]NCS85080.1 aminotransferase class V-fold PLP-dependent enzyme [Cyanobacteria bacterium CG_2